MMISHQLVISVLSMKMVKCYLLQLCKNYTTSDGILIGPTEQTNIHEICKFHLTGITPEQLKQNPITVHPNQKLDT